MVGEQIGSEAAGSGRLQARSAMAGCRQQAGRLQTECNCKLGEGGQCAGATLPQAALVPGERRR